MFNWAVVLRVIEVIGIIVGLIAAVATISAFITKKGKNKALLTFSALACFLLVALLIAYSPQSSHPLTGTLVPTSTTPSSPTTNPSNCPPSCSPPPTFTPTLPTPTRPPTWPRTLTAPSNKTMTCTVDSCPSRPEITAVLKDVVADDPTHARIFITVTNRTTATFQVVTDPPATLKDAGGSGSSAVAYFASDSSPLTANGTSTQPYHFSGVNTSPGKAYTFQLYLSRGGSWTYYYDRVAITF